MSVQNQGAIAGVAAKCETVDGVTRCYGSNDPCAHLGSDPIQYAACIDAQKKMAKTATKEVAIGLEVTKAPSDVAVNQDAVDWLKANGSTASKDQLIKMCTTAYPQAVDKCLEEMARKRMDPTEIVGQKVVGDVMIGGSFVDKSAAQDAAKDAIKTVQGFCSEGSACAAPVYGRPAWTWILAATVILLAAWGVDDA